LIVHVHTHIEFYNSKWLSVSLCDNAAEAWGTYVSEQGCNLVTNFETTCHFEVLKCLLKHDLVVVTANSMEQSPS